MVQRTLVNALLYGVLGPFVTLTTAASASAEDSANQSILASNAIVCQFGLPEQARVWSVLTSLAVYSVDHDILKELYPVVTELDSSSQFEEEYGADIDELSLPDRVVYLLENHYNEKSLAVLFKSFYNLYPTGLEFDNSGNCTHRDNSNYFVLNGKKYTKPDASFYLKSNELEEHLKAFNGQETQSIGDVIIGSNPQAPVLMFYGCPGSQEFEEFNRNLYTEATQNGESSKIRYIWRSSCSFDSSLSSPSSSLDLRFPLSLSIQENVTNFSALQNAPLNIPEGFKFPSNEDQLLWQPPTSLEQLSDLDLKVAAMIAQNYTEGGDFHGSFNFAKDIVNNFPLLLHQLIAKELNETVLQKIKMSNEDMKNVGIDYHMLGLFINGQYLRLTELNEYSLTTYIFMELQRVRQLESLLKTTSLSNGQYLETAKRLIEFYARVSFPTLQHSQPQKVDLHRVQGFSESVIYFNDIENDPQYADLSSNASVFFEKSKFGELPEYRGNWNELVFIIDFNKLNDSETRESLMGLNRALEVVHNGYPQRIGLIPMNSDPSNKAATQLIDKIYQLQKIDLEELQYFLKQVDARGYDVDLGQFSYLILKKLPDYNNVLKKLQIYQTSIAIDGEIHPFKRNTWNYIIAKVVKRDTAYIKSELKMLGSKRLNEGANIRNLLHLRSQSSRHIKYLPEYLGDTLYSTMHNDEALTEIRDTNIIEYTTSQEQLLLHTVTLVDNFDTYVGLRRLQNLVKLKFSGVRIRFIHTGVVSSTNWEALQNSVDDRKEFRQVIKELVEQQKEHKRKSEDGGNSDGELDDLDELNVRSTVPTTLFQRWLPDIPVEYLRTNRFLVVNGRFIHFGPREIPRKKQFEDIVQKEAQRTIDTAIALSSVSDELAQMDVDPDFMEMVSAALTKMYYHGYQTYRNGITYTTESNLPRMDLGPFLKSNNFTIFSKYADDRTAPIDIILIIDPIEERTQRLLTLVANFLDYDFINVRLALLPTEKVSMLPIERVYIEGTKQCDITQDILDNFEVGLETPPNFLMRNTNHLDSLVIEVHVFDENSHISEGTVTGERNVTLQLVDKDGNIVDEMATMTTFGYGQLHVPYPGDGFTVRCADSDNHEVISFSINGFSDYLPMESFSVTSFGQLKLYVKVREIDGNTVGNEGAKDRGDNVNIFTVLKSRKEEEQFQKMVLSIISGLNFDDAVDSKIIFWVLDEPFISQKFKKFVNKFNSKRDELNGEIKFVKYNWPTWIRPQRFRTREMDISKVLFMDLLFPQNVSRLVYLSPTEAPLDPINMLEDGISKHRPLSLFKMTGHGYWDEGYWQKSLKSRGLDFYTVNPGFVVNLDEFRKMDVGEKMRIHYQRLSADPNSLLNVDQDLINDMQLEVPLHKLDRSLLEPLEADPEFVEKWLDLLSSDSMLEEEESQDEEKTQSQDGMEDEEPDLEDFWHDEL